MIMIELCYTVYLGMCLNGVSRDILLLCADIILLPVTIFELQIMEAHKYVMIWGSVTYLVCQLYNSCVPG